MNETSSSFWNMITRLRNHDDKQRFQISYLFRLYPYVKLHLRKVAFASFLMVLAAVLAIPSPYLLKYSIDTLIPARDTSTLTAIILVVLGLGLASLAMTVIMNYNFSIAGQEILFSLKVDVLQRILKLPTGFFDQRQTGYLMSRVQEVQSLDTLFSSSTARLIAALLQFLLSLGVMFYLHWRLTLITLLTLPILYWLIKWVSDTAQSLSLELFENNATVSNDIQETLSGISTIKDFGSEEQHMRKLNVGLRRLFRSTTSQSVLLNIGNDVIVWITAVIGIVIFWLSARAIIASSFTLGGYIAFLGYLTKLLQPIQIFASINLSLQPSMIALSRIIELLDEKTEEDDVARTLPLTRLQGDIRFEDVSFSYDGERDVISHFNCHLKPGECTAIIGPSGSGKTTIIRLLLGLYKPTRGRILIDGQDLNDLVISDLRERVGIVSQSIFLFNDTIKANIRYSHTEADENSIVEAAKAADAHHFIMAMPERYDSIVGERGVRLSGGQMQRIALARAILKDPDLVILDEATSYVDEESEQKIFSAINCTFRDKSRIIISHRLCPTAKVDQIVRLNFS